MCSVMFLPIGSVRSDCVRQDTGAAPHDYFVVDLPLTPERIRLAGPPGGPWSEEAKILEQSGGSKNKVFTSI